MFVLIWRYRIAAENREAFVSAYGQSGVWARLFARGDGFVRTELLQDPLDASSFSTLDFWESRAAFLAFRSEHKSSYREIDATCEGLTDAETFIGAFEMKAGPADANELYGAGAE